MRRRHWTGAAALLTALQASAPRWAAADERPRSWHESLRDDETTRGFKLLDRNASWQLRQVVPMRFSTFHTQGLVKLGAAFFVSAVQVIEPRTSNGATTDALHDFTIDRSPGSGRGWLFKFDANGALLGRVELTRGAAYHPGGIDFDGRHLWVPVAEYRPNSRSHVYRVNPETLEAELLFSADDHIGGIVKNRHGGTLHGVSWGSRRLYTWTLQHTGPGQPPSVSAGHWQPNPQAYIDYQDCHYHGIEYMLCGGVASYTSPLGSIAFGGLDLVDLRRGRMEHQVPVNVFSDEGAGPNPGLALTHNAFWAEPGADGALRVYFMAESDNQADLAVYDVTPWIHR